LEDGFEKAGGEVSAIVGCGIKGDPVVNLLRWLYWNTLKEAIRVCDMQSAHDQKVSPETTLYCTFTNKTHPFTHTQANSYRLCQPFVITFSSNELSVLPNRTQDIKPDSTLSLLVQLIHITCLQYPISLLSHPKDHHILYHRIPTSTPGFILQPHIHNRMKLVPRADPHQMTKKITSL